MWDYEYGIIEGTKEGIFSPDAPVTRAQTVVMLWRYKGRPEPEAKENPFTDVSPDSYYYKALLWAYENGVTTGRTADKFDPNAPCTRGEIVTMIYRGAHIA